MPGEDFFSWSITAANNATADSSINWAEHQPRASVNDSARSMMAALAKQRQLRSGTQTTTGSANAQSFSSGLSYTVPPTGLRATLIAGLTNTGPLTLNMDSIGYFAVKGLRGNDLLPGQWLASTLQEIIFNGTVWISLGQGMGTQAVPAVTVYTTGTSVYTTPAGALYLVIEMIAGGGGGGPGYSGGTAPVGGNSSFGGLVTTGGSGGSVAAGGAGGFASGGDFNLYGGNGQTCANVGDGTALPVGGHGGASFFGGGGNGGYANDGTAGAAPGSGGGGGGRAVASAEGGGGGGAGGYLRKVLAPPTGGYNYSVGLGGGGGGAVGGSGGYNGGAGASGMIVITAYFA
jgi:hypothetical protein